MQTESETEELIELYDNEIEKPKRSCFYTCLVDQRIGKNDKGIWKVVYWNNEKQEWCCPFPILKWREYPPRELIKTKKGKKYVRTNNR